MGRNYIFPWKSAGDVHNIIWVGFCKPTETNGLYDCQLEKKIVCLYGPGLEREEKNWNPVASCLALNREDKRDEWDQFGSAFYE